MKLEDACFLEEKPQCIKKQRHHFANKGPSSQRYGFPVVMYGCESWTIKEAECWRTDAFELWCWRRLLRVPWTERRSNQSIKRKSILYIYWKDWCWSWNSSTLATWCEKLIHLKRPWCWERLKAGGEGDDRGWGGWMASSTQWTWVWVNSRSCWCDVGDAREAWCAVVHGVAKSQTRLSDRTELKYSHDKIISIWKDRANL